MKLNKESEQYLFLLQRSQLSVFRKSTGKIGTWKFDPKIVSRLEIKNEEEFLRTFEAFLAQMKLVSGEVTLLLDNSIYFTQEIKTQSDENKKEGNLKANSSTNEDSNKNGNSDNGDEEQVPNADEKAEEEEQRRKFVQSVPFSNTYSNIVQLGKKKVILVTNRDFYEPIIKKLAEKNYRVTHIFPLAVVGEVFDHGGYTPEAALMLLHSVDKFKSNDLLDKPMLSNQEPHPAPIGPIATSAPEDKTRLFVMIGAFVILLLILGGVIYWSGQRDQQASPTAVQQIPVSPIDGPDEQPIPIEETEEEIMVNTTLDLETFLTSTSSAEANYPQLTVEIQNSTGSDEAVQELRQNLIDSGFETVVLGQDNSTTTGPTLIRVSQNVPVILQELLIDELLRLQYDAKVLSVQESDVDITIVLTSV